MQRVIIEVPLERPLRTSIRPDVRHGVRKVLACCAECGTVKVFDSNPRNRFPDTGYWTECRACAEYRMFFRLERGRVVNECAAGAPYGPARMVPRRHGNLT